MSPKNKAKRLRMHELLTAAEMAEADRLAISGGMPSSQLMEKAGRAVADAVGRRCEGRHIIVVAGPGNNGGDGFVAARHLAERGHTVTVALVGERAKLSGDAAIAAERWTGTTITARPEHLVGKGTIIVDALFGAGLSRQVEGLPAAMIAAMNSSGSPVIAVDLPSGVNGTTGSVMGAAVKAVYTITFFRRKTGHLMLPGRELCGTLEVADIGIPESVLETIKPTTFLNEPLLWSSAFPVPAARDYKYTRGHVVVISGGLSSTGAARLAARGALRAGAGLVTIASPTEALATNAATSLAVMVHAVEGAAELSEFLADRRRNVVVLGPGCGVGSATREKARVALESGPAVVLDADALTSFADDAAALAAIIGKAPSRDVVLTPHDGEFYILFNHISKDTKVNSKLDKARAAAHMNGAVVVLKGADTVVAAPDGRASIARNAPPYLATAGSGDVLSGIIGGLLAQHVPAFEAASAAVWLHGEAASTFGPGLISEDLPEALPEVYRRLFSTGAVGQLSDR
jgi:hydroxyethylthiazole kinase-like uncharacterized protein yjeF